jgi:uncharacterized protein (DUF2164 family)
MVNILHAKYLKIKANNSVEKFNGKKILKFLEEKLRMYWSNFCFMLSKTLIPNGYSKQRLLVLYSFYNTL